MNSFVISFLSCCAVFQPPTDLGIRGLHWLRETAQCSLVLFKVWLIFGLNAFLLFASLPVSECPACQLSGAVAGE